MPPVDPRTRSRRWVLPVLVLPSLLPGIVHAQVAGEPPADLSRSTAYVEVGGLPAFEGGAYTINYELRVLRRAYARLGVFAGAEETFDGASPQSDRKILVPLMLNVLLTGERHHLEAGAGTRVDILPEGWEARAAAAFGYRFQPPGKGLVVRAGLAFDLGEIPSGSDWTLYPWPSLSLGYSF